MTSDEEIAYLKHQIEYQKQQIEALNKFISGEEKDKDVEQEKYKIIHSMFSRDNNILNISWLCEIDGVSRSGYYSWLHRDNTKSEY